MTQSQFPRTIAIIGGGVSGTLVAANLLRRAREPVRILLIERHPPVGRGVAYRATEGRPLLNVPAGQMGIWPEDPGHFVHWLRVHRGEPGVPAHVDPEEFCPRDVYGLYVERVFADLRADAPAGAECEHVLGEVVDLDEKPGGGAVLALQDGRALDADLVVLAVGHLPGAYPIPRPLPVYQSSRYVHAPWSGAPLAGLSADDDILIVGQGLTAVDLIVQLAERGHRGKVHALSRHGVQPRVHAPYRPHPAFLASEPLPTSVRTLVRRVREEISAATRSGSNWRAVIDGLRPYSQALWRALSLVERRRFLRHVRPLWEVHRHRIAPQAAALVGRLVDAGRLVFHAGRLQTLDVDDGGIDALIRCRGSIRHLALRVGRVFNCSGPRTDYSKYQHPLLVHLLARGLIDHDPLALGVDALPGGEVLRYRGGPVGWLYTLGAPLRGIVWESTAVREIRAQASALAEKILAQPAAVELAAAEG